MASHERLDYIHGLRGLAALLVVAQHAMQIPNDAGNMLFRPILDTVNLGRFGVVLFFLISGFVIPFSFKPGLPQTVRQFWLGRFFRLYPAYWLSLIATVTIFAMWGRPFSASLIAQNVTMLQGFWGSANIGPGYWTLTLEMAFYAMCAMLFARGQLRNVDLIGFGVLLGLALVCGPYVTKLYFGAPRYLPLESFFLVFFFLGMVVRMAVIDGDEKARRWAMLLVPAITLGTFVHGGGFFPVPVNANPYLRPLPVISATLAAVLFFLAVLRWQPRFSAMFMYFGTISYSVYLFQDVGLHLLPRWMPAATYPAAFCLAVLGMTVVIAALVYALVEKPMLDLGRRVSARSLRPSPAPLAA